MAAVLYFGNDDRLPQILQAFFDIRKKDAGEVHSITRAADFKKFEEALLGIAFDLAFVEQIMLDKGPVEWLTTFKKKYPRITFPMILTGAEHEPAKIMKFIETGFVDYFVDPPDKPLVIEKFVMFSTGKRNADLRQVYSLKLSQPSDLAKPGYLEELSEFDCKIRTGQAVAVNDMILLYAPSFSANGETKGTVLGRCYDCKEHSSFQGQFLASFFFMGVTPDILTNIRNSLRKSYIASKTKS